MISRLCPCVSLFSSRLCSFSVCVCVYCRSVSFSPACVLSQFVELIRNNIQVCLRITVIQLDTRTHTHTHTQLEDNTGSFLSICRIHLSVFLLFSVSLCRSVSFFGFTSLFPLLSFSPLSSLLVFIWSPGAENTP